MGFSDRILGKKNVNGGPHIEAVSPALALAGGEVRISGSGLRPPELRRPRVQFGEVEGTVVISSDGFVVARVPEGATSGPVVVATNGHRSNPHALKVAVPIAEMVSGSPSGLASLDLGSKAIGTPRRVETVSATAAGGRLAGSGGKPSVT